MAGVDRGDAARRLDLEAQYRRSHRGQRICLTCALALGVGTAGTIFWYWPWLWNRPPSPVDETPRVRVKIYGMAGCPFTRGFVAGPVGELMGTVPELVDLEFVPFGNSYYPTEECGGSGEGQPYASYNPHYDVQRRMCWEKLCGADATERPGDCYSGDLICQHGTTDGMVTAAWACAKEWSNNVSSLYIPFFQCTARRFLAVVSNDRFSQIMTRCAVETGLNPYALQQCSQNYDALNAQGRITVPHPGAPHVLIDGEVLDDTECSSCGDGLLPTVCRRNKANGGAESPVCDAILR